jgi:translation initiation factor IF-2
MTEQELSSVKVYELAKELGIPPLSLVERLKDLRIQVKNHMSDLSPQDVSAARSALGKRDAKPASTGSSAPKKTVTRTRKKTDEAAPAAASTAPAAAPAAKPAAPSKTDTAAGAAKPSTVIRRRVKEDGATETILPQQLTKQPEPETAAPAEEMTFEPSTATFTPVATEEPTEATVSAAPEEVEATSLEAPQAATSTPSSSVEEEPAAPVQKAAEAPQAVAPTIKKAPIILPPRPVAPRKSFLKIVEATALPQKPKVMPPPAPPSQPKQPAMRGQQTQDKDGFRIIRMTKENLDQMVEEEAAKKRGGGGGGREQEIRPEDVRFADYRKKEMVFLPKKKKLPVGKALKKTEITVAKASKRVVEMQNQISVQDLAGQLGVKAVDVIRKLMGMGVMATINQQLDFDTASLIAGEYQFEVKNVAFDETALLTTPIAEDPSKLAGRPPIVTIMGHVDHGKTSLLDAIREADVAGGEAGGITQHIGAYTVVKDGHKITFIDTPGHEAFTVMRARGANVTDIVILVVAADDGVMPQTREALSHAKAAKVPIIVAVNKIDKPAANPEKVKQALAELDLLAEDWGGQTMFVPVSALKKTNLDKLLESILLQAEVLDLKADPTARAEGTVLEARLDKGRGPVVSLLVRKGTLQSGDTVVASQYCGRVRAMTDHTGRSVKEAGPGIAVEVLGLEGVPTAGDPFNATETEADARKIASHRIEKARAQVAGAAGKMSLDSLFAKMKTGNMKELNVILKADVFGSVEAIRDSLVKQSNDKVTVKVISASTGGITESDVMLASASEAIIIGFNVRPETKARQVAEAEHVEIKTYSIIYELIDDIKNAMVGLLDKKKVEKFMGRAEVRQTFTVPKIGTIAGCGVIDGKITRGSNVRLLRDSRIIYEGKISSLKRFKDDAKEVAEGFECGIGIEGYNDLKAGDLIEAYIIEMVTPELNA